MAANTANANAVNPEVPDVIGQLLEAEKHAAAILANAQIEGDKRVTRAKAEAAEKYKSQYEALMSEMEASYTKETNEINAKYNKDIEDYKTSLQSHTLDAAAFNALMAKLLNRG
jgi:F0F1-type ATP synthase membrane subunit b/b'